MGGTYRFAIFLMLGLAVAAPVHAERFPELTASYSADVTQTTEVSGETMVHAGRLWVDGDRMRMEVRADGEQFTRIMRGDTGEMFLIEGQSDVAYRMPLPSDTSGLLTRELVEESLDPQFEGRETLDGHEALVFRIQGTNAMGQRNTGRLWVTPDGVLLRRLAESEAGDEAVRVEIELRNVSRGPQEPALFELSEGAEVMDM